jgi:hypothetical protein
VHGYPRYTGDFGFADLEIDESEFLVADTIVEIGREPLKIQVMNEISGVSFEEAASTQILVPVDGMKVPFISLEMLIKNKLSTKRDKDRIDAEILRDRNQ